VLAGAARMVAVPLHSSAGTLALACTYAWRHQLLLARCCTSWPTELSQPASSSQRLERTVESRSTKEAQAHAAATGHDLNSCVRRVYKARRTNVRCFPIRMQRQHC
jgi:hypothetical protein